MALDGCGHAQFGSHQSPAPQSGPKDITVDVSSVTSLKLIVLHDDVEIGSATGFVVAKGSKHYLVTTLAAGADLVALPLKKIDNVQFYPPDMELRRTDIVVGPADPVSIVGFPVAHTIIPKTILGGLPFANLVFAKGGDCFG